ncbi:MAG: MGMT family protein [Candidatus Aenigmarchaeota archaeon]|nr:MGMT family protein [Candidatus Aenigmarchaeota archaeon]
MHKAYLLLRKIPRGKVATYGTLARACNTSPRAVGSLMRSNKHPDLYPCYKVVKSGGNVGNYSGAGGAKRKISLLKKDGIEVRDGKINLKKFGYKFIE